MSITAQNIFDQNRIRLSRVQTSESMPADFSFQSVRRSPTQAIADLEWQIRFTQMKLNAWRDADDLKWERLRALNEEAKSALSRLRAFE